MWASESPSKDQKEDQNKLISKGQDKQTSDQIKQMSKDQKDQMSEDWNKQPLIHVQLTPALTDPPVMEIRL